MPGLKRPLLGFRVLASQVVVSFTAGKRQRGAPIPHQPWERRVHIDAPALDDDREKTMDVHEPILGDNLGDPGVEHFPSASAIQLVDTMND